MEKEYDENNIDWNAIEGDFMGFLEEKRYDDCNTIIDNLAEQKEFSKALELCMKRCAAIMKDRMTLPSDYGEEKPTGVAMTAENSPNGTAGGGLQFDERNNPLNGVEDRVW